MPLIKPVSSVGSHKQGTLIATYEDIVKVLGFKPNAQDDPCKVRYSWAFTIDGQEAAIWDWKGSADENRWSYYNPAVAALFQS